MNVVVTSRDEILKNSLKLIQQQGWSSVSIRAVAAACGVGAVALRAESQPVTASAAAVMAAMANEPIFFIFVGVLILIFVQS